MTTLPVIGFAGMTHLGLNSAVAGAERGFPMVGFDPDPALVDRLCRGEMPVVEPELDALAARNRERIGFTADAGVLKRCDVVYVAPDVATDDQGRSDLAGINRLLDLVVPQIRADATLVILSQVPPGFTRALARPGLSLYYQVETLIFGRAIERALKPERYIVGCAEPAEPFPEAYRVFLEAHGCPILPMRYESAELAKISINMCLVASISVANTLAELCEGIGAVWSEIAPALKLDRRIGPYSYLSPGLGIAGGNLERDLATVIRLGAEVGSDTGVVQAWIANSRHRRDWAAKTLMRLLDGLIDPTVAVLGLTYKENTHSVKNSPSLATIAQLPRSIHLTVYDPAVTADVVDRDGVTGAVDALAACRDADVLAILTPWPAFRTLVPAEIGGALRGRVVLDPYGVLNADACSAAGLDYYTLGRPRSPGVPGTP